MGERFEWLGKGVPGEEFKRIVFQFEGVVIRRLRERCTILVLHLFGVVEIAAKSISVNVGSSRHGDALCGELGLSRFEGVRFGLLGGVGARYVAKLKLFNS